MLKVNKIFYSIQGEGKYVGQPATFIRLAGCNRACNFCDTQHEAALTYEVSDILSQVHIHPSMYVVITGGEPLLQYSELVPLLAVLNNYHYHVSLETNGTIDLPSKDDDANGDFGHALNGFDHITVSPKSLDSWILRYGFDALKLVYTGQDLSAYETIVHDLRNAHKVSFNVQLYLQPRWMTKGQSEWLAPIEAVQFNMSVMRATAKKVMENPKWRLSLQTHKILDLE